MDHVSHAKSFYSRTFFYENHLQSSVKAMFQNCVFAGELPGDDDIKAAKLRREYEPLTCKVINVEGDFLSKKRIKSQGEAKKGSNISARASTLNTRGICRYCGKIVGNSHSVFDCENERSKQLEASDILATLSSSVSK